MSDSRDSQATNASPSTLIAWGQLVRLPNVFTVIADVAAAFLLVSGGPQPIGRFGLVIAGGISLYWAGMILNDVFDIEQDRAERSARPLAAGHIPLSVAKIAGWGLLVLGVAIAATSGYFPADNIPDTWLPALVATSLAIMIVAYDGPLKRTPAAPTAMGLCRVLSFLLGASPVLMIDEGPLIPKYLLGCAVGFGTYVMGLTLLGRREAAGGYSTNLPTGVIVTALGGVMMAFAPQLARGPMGWQLSVRDMFPILIGMIVLPVLVRAYRAVMDPTPQKIQTAVRIGILTIIPLSAAFAFLGAGQAWGLAIFALVIPSIGLSTRFRVT